MIGDSRGRGMLLALVAFVGALAAFLLVFLFGPATPDARAVAERALADARSAAAEGAVADALAQRVAAGLPGGARVTLVVPDGLVGVQRQGLPVQLMRADTDRAAVTDELSRSGLVATVASDDGWWVAASVSPTGSRLVTGLGAAAIVASAVLVGGLLRRSPAPGLPPHVSPDVSLERRIGQLSQQRAKLVQSLAELIPQMPDALSWQATNALAAAGINVLSPEGQPFDPAVHHVVGTEVTSDPRHVDTVARTIRPGYIDGNRVVVHPKVVVYAYGTAGER